MLIGLISDTHDHLIMIEKAVAFFNKRKVEVVLHAGDVISPFTARKFKDCNAKLILVYGNNDGDRSNLQRMFSEIGAQFYWPAAILELDGKKTLLLHGEDSKLIEEIASKNMFDLIVSGHTHEEKVRRIGVTLWINPGEACGYLTGRSTIGVYDSSTHEVEIFEL
ncbi:MAG: metallophosphoesterase [Crenarchaeota archaeon]|nr:metallophosphoesterase [Thermoproteota archaeon]MDW8034009.1 metallophosphoesterase [Nitrososphaerota archaeon]